jgi:hypothetical protein
MAQLTAIILGCMLMVLAFIAALGPAITAPGSAVILMLTALSFFGAWLGLRNEKKLQSKLATLHLSDGRPVLELVGVNWDTTQSALAGAFTFVGDNSGIVALSGMRVRRVTIHCYRTPSLVLRFSVHQNVICRIAVEQLSSDQAGQT